MNRFAHIASLITVIAAILCTGVIAYYNSLTITPLIEGWVGVIAAVLLCFCAYVGGLIYGLTTELPAPDDDTYLK